VTSTTHRPASAGCVDSPRREIEAYLTDFVTAHTAALVQLDPELEPLARTAAQAVLGSGKRLRPVFGYWGWRGVAGPDARPAEVVPALAALEMLHAFALVHDDVIDESPLRRGRPSAHAALSAGYRGAVRDGTAERFGRDAAILVGDLCLVWADELLALTAVPAATILRARQVYDRMRVETIAGQFLDVLGEVSSAWSLARAQRVVLLKTAAYTVIWPLHFGATLARPDPCCPPDEPGPVEAYTRYGAVERRIRARTAEALAVLDTASIDPAARAALADLALLAAQRTA
jgi:geranylgeranyl diphosphate synthase type I